MWANGCRLGWGVVSVLRVTGAVVGAGLSGGGAIAARLAGGGARAMLGAGRMGGDVMLLTFVPVDSVTVASDGAVVALVGGTSDEGGVWSYCVHDRSLLVFSE